MNKVDEELFRQVLIQHRRGDIAGAVAQYQRLLQQDPRDPQVLHYLGLAQLQLGHLQAAENHLDRSLRIAPDEPNVLCDFATLKMAQKKYAAAEEMFKRVLKLRPNHTDALHNLAKAYSLMGHTTQALPLLERLTAIRPDSVSAFRHLGDTHYSLGEVDSAIAAYRKCVRLDADDKLSRVNLGDAYESAGKFKQAKMHYASVLRREVDSPLALAGILQLPDEDVPSHWLTRAHVLAASDNTDSDARIRLNTALAQYYDRRREFPSAFRHMRAAKDEKFSKKPYDSQRFTVATKQLIEVFDAEYFNALRPDRGSRSARPIFIVGMPRSGTTLTEQILASHVQIAAGGELSTLPNLARQAQQLSPSRQPYPYGVKDLLPESQLLLAEQYVSRLDRVSTRALRVTDKLPFNFMHLGLIATLLPSARIIHCTRDPLDTCLSCYFTNFSEEIRFANNLDTLGKYYIDYARLMSHWRDVLPIPVFEMPYESYIDDTENVTRGLIEFCGLEWNDACLSFYETRRGVRTPSRWQVRQPIYRKSAGRWRNYERELHSLRQTLASTLNGAGA